MRSLALSFVLLTLPSAISCVSDEADKGEEEELDLLSTDSKADSFRAPTWHGEAAFGVPHDAVLQDDERHHAWWFDLSGEAQVDMTTTYTVRGQRRTDTVLYFYKQLPNGNWGSYIARNDDYGNTTYSQIKRTLGAGRYRVLVKGHTASTEGKFRLNVTCVGQGCQPAAPSNACLFGTTYGELLENPNLGISQRITITAANLDQFDARLQSRIVRAVQESSHTDVTTAAEALSRVDQEEINYNVIIDSSGRRTYTVFEYGAGDNSYGAVFDHFTDEMATAIHDGDLYECNVTPKTCLLPETWYEMRQDPAYPQVSRTVVTNAADLTGVTAEQALKTFQQSYDDVTTVAEGLERVDQNEVNVYVFKHAASGALFDVIEFGAGDTSVGSIFFKGTANRAAQMRDQDIQSCRYFAD